MYNVINVVKFNDQYFENNDIVAITKENGNVIVGRIMIRDYDGSKTTDYSLLLDVSEKYSQKREHIIGKDIKNIQLVNQ